MSFRKGHTINSGRKQTKEHIKKRMIGSSASWFKKGEIPVNKGVPHSQETRKKISEAKKGKKLTQKHKKKLSKLLKIAFKNRTRKPSRSFLGKKHSSEHKKRMSKLMKFRKRPDLKGENNGNWKGGIEKEAEI